MNRVGHVRSAVFAGLRLVGSIAMTGVFLAFFIGYQMYAGSLPDHGDADIQKSPVTYLVYLVILAGHAIAHAFGH